MGIGATLNRWSRGAGEAIYDAMNQVYDVRQSRTEPRTEYRPKTRVEPESAPRAQPRRAQPLSVTSAKFAPGFDLIVHSGPMAALPPGPFLPVERDATRILLLRAGTLNRVDALIRVLEGRPWIAVDSLKRNALQLRTVLEDPLFLRLKTSNLARLRPLTILDELDTLLIKGFERLPSTQHGDYTELSRKLKRVNELIRTFLAMYRPAYRETTLPPALRAVATQLNALPAPAKVVGVVVLGAISLVYGAYSYFAD